MSERTISEIPLDDIYSDEEFNCRGAINPIDVFELSKDIAARGLDQPITIRPYNKNGKKYQVVAGFRRFLAHRVNNAKTILAMVRDLDDTDALFLNLRENVQRQDLNIKQEANAIFKLRYLPRHEIATRVNKSDGWVQNRLYMHELPEDIQDEIVAGLIPAYKIREISQEPTVEMMYEAARNIKDAKLKNLKTEPKKASKKNEIRIRSRAEIMEMIKLIMEHVGGGLATRALAWACGNICDLELHEDIAKESDYVVPKELKNGEV